MARRYPIKCQSAEATSVSVSSLSVWQLQRKQRLMFMSIRRQISLCDEVCESLSICPALTNFGQFQLHGAETQSEPNILAELVDSDGSTSAWIHTFFMNLLLKSLIMFIKDILGPIFLYPILCTVQETSLDYIHTEPWVVLLACCCCLQHKYVRCNCVKMWCGSTW